MHNDKNIKLQTNSSSSATAATVRRVIEIADKIIQGEPRYKLLKYISKAYGVAEPQAKRYYDAALKYLVPSEEEQADFREKMRAKLLARYEELYQGAVENRNTKIAKEVLDSMAKIYGLSGGDKVSIKEDMDGSKEITISFD